ncbi:MAG: hypothetical protein Q8R32_01010 [bacterium]|nr:hypothetical protein [bacterium]
MDGNSVATRAQKTIAMHLAALACAVLGSLVTYYPFLTGDLTGPIYEVFAPGGQWIIRGGNELVRAVQILVVVLPFIALVGAYLLRRRSRFFRTALVYYAGFGLLLDMYVLVFLILALQGIEV